MRVGKQLFAPDPGPLPVAFSVTADVRPARHLAVAISPDTSLTHHWERAPLTQREREILTLVACGLHGGDVADRLFLSPETVKTHVHNAMSKLGSRTRAHAVAIALVTGQIPWDVARG